MILKYLTKIAAARNTVLLLLILPAFMAVFFSHFQFTLIPESPYLRYDLEIEVPGMIAKEIEKKITIPTEKIMNGLPGLLQLESLTENERTTTHLTFKAGSKEGPTFLFIQEKLDRLKIILPAEAERIKVENNKQASLADLELSGPSLEQLGAFVERLQDFKQDIRRMEPDLSAADLGTARFSVTPNLNLLSQHGIGLDGLWKALKINSFSYNLGSKNDLSYFVSGNFASVSALENIVIGARQAFLIRLGDVAKVELASRPLPKKLSVWFDHREISLVRFFLWARENLKQEIFQGLVYKLPFATAFIKDLKKPLLAFLFILMLQMILGKYLFHNLKACASYLVLDAVLALHFLFWVGILKREITLLDFQVLLFTIIITSYFWTILMGRVRSFFYESNLHTSIKRQLPQAILFSLAEYLPTMVMLLTCLFILCLPLILTDLSLVSQFLALRFFIFGAPLCVLCLVILALFSPLRWIVQDGKNLGVGSFNFLPVPSLYRKTGPLFGFAILILLLLSPLPWYFLKFGVKGPQDSLEADMLGHFRGHGKVLSYLLPEGQAGNGALYDTHPDKTFKQQFLETFSVTTQGLGLMPELDLTSFKMALTDFIKGHALGSGMNVDSLQDSWPVHLKLAKLSSFDFSQLALSHSKKGPIPLSVLTGQKIEAAPSQIYRAQLEARDEISLLQEGVNRQSLPLFDFNKLQLGNNAQPVAAPFTEHLAQQFFEYKRHAPFIFLFLFLLLSLYLNSFYRSGILLGLGIIPYCVFPGAKALFASSFHLDTLMLLSLPLWMTLATILFLSRSMDTERSRGNDRSDVLKESQVHFWPVVICSGLFFTAGLAVLGLADLMFKDDGPNVHFEALGISAVVGLAVIISANQFFRLYYLVAQVFIERQALKLILVYFRLRARLKFGKRKA